MKNQESLLRSSLKYSFYAVTSEYFKFLWYFVAGGFLGLASSMFLSVLVLSLTRFLPMILSIVLVPATICMAFYLFTKYTSTLSNNLLDLYDGKPFRGFSYAFMRREVALVVLMQWLCWFLLLMKWLFCLLFPLFPIFGFG